MRRIWPALALLLLILPLSARGQGTFFSDMVEDAPAATLPLAPGDKVPVVQGGVVKSYDPGGSNGAMLRDGSNATLPTATTNLGPTTIYAKNYGVSGNRIDAADGAVGAASKLFTSASATFTAGDVGDIILIAGAGASGHAHLTTIESYVNPNTVMLTNAAVTAVSGAAFSYATNAVPAAQLAVNAAAALPAGGRVLLPAGKYIINPAINKLTLASNVTLDGEGAAHILCASLLDSATAADNACIFGTGLDNIEVRGLIIRGVADLTPTRPVQDFGGPVFLPGNTNVRIIGNQSSYVRTYNLSANASTTVTIADNTVSYGFSAAASCGGCSGSIIVARNHFDHMMDAVTAISTGDAQADPSGVRGVVFEGNVVTESVGVQISGGRSIVVNGNSFTRTVGQAIFVFPFSNFDAGDTPTSSVSITNNTVLDVINHRPGQALVPSYDAYIVVGGGTRQAGGGDSIPGYPVVATGVITDLYGTNTSGNFFKNNTDDTSIASPGSIAWNISNNVLARTLPAVASVSQWGYGDNLWAASPPGTLYTGAIAEADLQLNCITVREGSMRLSSISNNICATTGDYGVNLLKTPVVTGDYDGLKISGNTFYDYNIAGIRFGSNVAASTQVSITGNDFNGDPRFRAANRAAGGTWSANNGPLGISSANVAGLFIDGNKYRNVVSPYYFNSPAVSVAVGDNETIFGIPAAVGFSTSNIGVGAVSGISGANNLFKLVCEDGDPRNATFGNVLYVTGLSYSAVPSTGCWLRGTFVRNSGGSSVDAQGRTLVGWHRLTTGTGNIVDTDWSAIYSDPPTGAWLAGNNFQSGTTYTVLSSDIGKVLGFSNAGAIAVTLPTAGSAGFESNKCFGVITLGAGTVTITPSSGLINGAASKAYATGVGGTVCAVATNYWAF